MEETEGQNSAETCRQRKRKCTFNAMFHQRKSVSVGRKAKCFSRKLIRTVSSLLLVEIARKHRYVITVKILSRNAISSNSSVGVKRSHSLEQTTSGICNYYLRETSIFHRFRINGLVNGSICWRALKRVLPFGNNSPKHLSRHICK